MTSTAVWAPAIVNVEDLPEFVSTAEGVYTARSRDFPAEHQLIEYNIALLAKVLAEVDHGLLPPMTELPFPDLHNVPPGIAQWDARMDYNMYIWYPVH